MRREVDRWVCRKVDVFWSGGMALVIAFRKHIMSHGPWTRCDGPEKPTQSVKLSDE